MSNSNQVSGIVVSLQANYLEVEVVWPHKKQLSNRFLCTKRNRLKYKGTIVYVGDIVYIDEINLDNFTAVVEDVKPRSNLLSRPPVANVKQVLLVLSIKEPLFDLNQATRFLMNIEKDGLDVVVVLNKVDLVSSIQVQDCLLRIYKWGYKAIAISVQNGFGIEEFKKIIDKSGISVVCGPSGVGKSSLMKKLVPNQPLSIGKLSRRLQRGKHTTRHTELFSVTAGSLVADTPGFNRPLINIDARDLSDFFPEIRNQLDYKSCKFRNCLHRDEVGCQIDKTWERYSLYLKLIDELLNSHYSSPGV